MIHIQANMQIQIHEKLNSTFQSMHRKLRSTFQGLEIGFFNLETSTLHLKN